MTDTRCVPLSETRNDPIDLPETRVIEASPVLESLQSLGSQSDSEAAGTWTFRALIKGSDWDPSIFTRVLNDCTSLADSALKNTLDMTGIFSYACCDRSTVVPDGSVAVEGFLKIKGSRQVRRGTLRRRLRHPDLDRIDCTACMVGRQHERARALTDVH